MQHAISSFIPFPPISYWTAISAYPRVCFDMAEHFEKMSYRNRYCITGANGPITLSIPIVNGRNQRSAMGDIRIHNKDKWQLQHWRTLSSVYRRSPYFEFYQPSLEKLFTTEYELLSAFNLASIHWLKGTLGLAFNEEMILTYNKDHDAALDLRNIKPSYSKKTTAGFPEYVQLFSERNGFIPDLSILDLLFAEGPYTTQWINENTKKNATLGKKH